MKQVLMSRRFWPEITNADFSLAEHRRFVLPYLSLYDGKPVGVVTSGTQTPFLKKSIGMAYVPIELAGAGTEIDIDIRGRVVKARVVPMPFYKRAT
jgi:glycine cleavage system aminomethyltransferase T